tara:strand:+ start:281 stop:688 length:408 start_codon:yes stop_codon:yes gene_type:complete
MKHLTIIGILSISIFNYIIAENKSALINDNSNQLSFLSEKEKDNKHKKLTDKWFAIDKLQHFSYSCLIALGCQYILVNKLNNSEKSSLPISSGLSFCAGLFKELNDNRGKNGYFSMKDIVANLGGIYIASIIISQ